MAVSVQFDLLLGAPFASGVARIIDQVVIIVLVVISLLEGSQSFHVCRHLETEKHVPLQTQPGASKQMTSRCVYIHGVT